MAGAAGYSALGLNEEQVEALNTLNEGFTKNHNKQYLRFGTDLYVHDPTYLNSYGVFQEIALTFHRELKEGKLIGESAQKRIFDAAHHSLKAMIAPFADEAMTTSLAWDLLSALKDEQGRTPRGKQVFKDEEDFWDTTGGIVKHIATHFAPGFYLDGKKYAEAVFETPNPTTGQKRSLKAKTIEMLTGINFSKFTPEDRFAGHINAYNRRKRYEITRPTSRYGKGTDEFFDEYSLSQSRKYGAMQELYRHILAMQDLGWTGEDIKLILKEHNVKDINEQDNLIKGKFWPDKLSELQKNLIEWKMSGSEEERNQNMQALATYTDYISKVSLHPVDNLDIQIAEDLRSKFTLKEFEKNVLNSNMPEERKREGFIGGGLVKDVSRVPEEPDERRDKETGRSYSEQAGGAFIDIEDRFGDPLSRLGFGVGGAVDPLRRLGFVGGGVVDPLVRLGFASGSFVYNIERGDTLSEIAEKHGVSQLELQNLNKIKDPDKIFEGSDLLIPTEESVLPETTSAFMPEDTANLAAETIQEVVASDRDLEQELAVEERRGRSFSFFPEAQAATLEPPPEAPEDYSGVWGGGMQHLHHSLNDIKKELDEGTITQVEAGVRAFGARIDMVFAPVGELIGTVASTLTPDVIEDPLKKKIGEIGQEVAQFLEENPGWKRSAKNVNALFSILGVVPAAQILKRGANMFAAGTKTKLEDFYNIREGTELQTATILDETGQRIKVQKEKPITRPFESKKEQVRSQIIAAGIAFSQAIPNAVIDALVPGMMGRRRAGVAASKRKEILEEGKYIDTGWWDHYGSIAAARNIIDQSPNLDKGKLITGGPIERSYVYGTVKMSDNDKVKASLFNDYNDFDIPEAIQQRAMNHLYSGPWTEGINVTVRGRKISSERPLNPNNTDIDIKRPDGPQQLLRESHGDVDQAANSLRKLFKESNRIKIAKYVNQLNPDGTIKSGVKLNKEGNITKSSLNVNRNKDVDVDKVLNDITPEQIKSWLTFDAGGKQGAGIKFKVDPDNPNIIYWADNHTSKSKESGGVNDFIAMDLKTKDIYVMVSDKHDMLANLNPIGGSSRLTVSPMSKRNFLDPKKKGGHTERDFQGEAQAALDMLERENIGLPEGGLRMPEYDPITGLIPLKPKITPIVGGHTITIEDLKKIANSKNIERKGNDWYVDGNKMDKGKLDGGVQINATVLSNYAGKATAADYGTLARRVGKIYVATAGGGESIRQEQPQETTRKPFSLFREAEASDFDPEKFNDDTILRNELRNHAFERLGIEDREEAENSLRVINGVIVYAESKNNYQAINENPDPKKRTTASGGYQFLDEAAKTAANRTLNTLAQIENFRPDLEKKERLLEYRNSESAPQWLLDVSEGKTRALDLTPERQQILFEGDMFERKGSDDTVKKMLKGDEAALSNYYNKFHRTDPEGQPNTKENWENSLEWWHEQSRQPKAMGGMPETGRIKAAEGDLIERVFGKAPVAAVKAAKDFAQRAHKNGKMLSSLKLLAQN